MSNETPLLKVENLSVEFTTDSGVVKAVDDISFEVGAGEPVGIVGESGSGKSVTALTLLQLVPDPPGRITGGRIELDGIDILSKSQAEMRKIRGDVASMIFQEPMTALNPVFRVGSQISEALLFHKNMKKDQARNRAIELLKLVGIPAPEKRFHDFPHQLSGGMRQRIIIAMALACSPRVILADEPTTALDVTIQAQILELIKELQEKRQTSTVLITHDLGVVAQVCDEMAVMYAGRIVEHAQVSEILANPRHPYTRGLLASLPRLDREAELSPIPGTVPEITNLPAGCHFHPRCPEKTDICSRREPPVNKAVSKVRCWLYNE